MSKPTLATLSKDIAYIKEAIAEIKLGIMPKNEIELRMIELQTDIQTFRLQMTTIERHVNRRFRWEVIGSNILTAFLVSVLTILVSYVVHNR